MPTRLILHSKYIITNLLIEDLLQQSSQNFQSNAIGFQLMKFLNSEDLKWINNSWLNFFNPSFIKVTNSLHQTSYSSIVWCHDLSNVNMTGKTTLRIILYWAFLKLLRIYCCLQIPLYSQFLTDFHYHTTICNLPLSIMCINI